MKKFILSIFLILLTSAFSIVFAQVPPPAGSPPGAPVGAGAPAGASDRNLQDNEMKMRSVEIDRIKREAEKTKTDSFSTINTKVESKFPQIKEDFENIQISQAAIIKTYTADKKIDYSLIEISADNMNKYAKRLDTNLFAEKVKISEDVPDDKSKESVEKPKTMRDLIVELDNAIGSFVSSKIFGNIKVIDPEVAVKTRKDLMLIEMLSEKLSIEAQKLK